MSQSKAARDRIRTFVQRIERIDEELACMNADKSEVYKEAKGEGYDLAALRLVISERRKRAKNPDLYRETRSLFDLYMDAVEGSSGTDRATRVHDRPPPTQAMGIAVDPDPNVTIINETPAPAHKEAAGGATPSPSTSAQPSAGSPAEEEASTSVGQPVSGNADEDVHPTNSDTDDDGLDIPTFMKRDANNRAPWMEGTG